MKIAVVEDTLDIMYLLVTQLNIRGYEVVSFESGAAFMAWLPGNHVDLVLLDVMLPGKDGYETCTEIRATHSKMVLPVIMLSALGHDADSRIKGLRAGANDFVAKPYSFAELEERIQSCLALKIEASNTETLLSRYVPVALRSVIGSDPPQVSKRRRQFGTIMFADLRGFTRLTATTAPENLLNLLDAFFESMMKVVSNHGGVVLDITGDELLTVFSIPQPVPVPGLLAVQTALEMQALFGSLKATWAQEGMDIGLGIGIHQGEVTVGDVGGGALKRFTVIGNPVNIAHRLLEQARDGQIVVSEAVHREAVLPVTVTATHRPDLMLKGISSPQSAYVLEQQSP